jgi:acetylglutamate kinase
MARGGVSGGMLPKLESVLSCLAAGMERVHVASWRQPAVLAGCLLGQDLGTLISGA